MVLEGFLWSGCLSEKQKMPKDKPQNFWFGVMETFPRGQLACLLVRILSEGCVFFWWFITAASHMEACRNCSCSEREIWHFKTPGLLCFMQAREQGALFCSFLTEKVSVTVQMDREHYLQVQPELHSVFFLGEIIWVSQGQQPSTAALCSLLLLGGIFSCCEVQNKKSKLQ